MKNNAEYGNTVCPICNTVPDTGTGRCGCAKKHARGASSGELVAQAESLFETYLAARLVRTRRNLTLAKIALLRDPRNRARLEDLRRAETEAECLETQLLDQARKAAQARDGRGRDAASTPRPGAGAMSAEATEDFRALQAVRAEGVYNSNVAAELGRRSRPDDRECPNCASRVPGEVMACECGYQFGRAGSAVPAEPFLSDEELAALRGESKGLKRAD